MMQREMRSLEDVERDEELREDDAERDERVLQRYGRLKRMMMRREMGGQRGYDAEKDGELTEDVHAMILGLWNVGKRSSGIGSICNKCNEKGLQPMPVTCVGCAECMCYYFS